jgi:hypothetical protein
VGISLSRFARALLVRAGTDLNLPNGLGADKRRPPDVFVFFAERPPIAVGIKGPMNFWIWYHTKLCGFLGF